PTPPEKEIAASVLPCGVGFDHDQPESLTLTAAVLMPTSAIVADATPMANTAMKPLERLRMNPPCWIGCDDLAWTSDATQTYGTDQSCAATPPPGPAARRRAPRMRVVVGRIAEHAHSRRHRGASAGGGVLDHDAPRPRSADGGGRVQEEIGEGLAPRHLLRGEQLLGTEIRGQARQLEREPRLCERPLGGHAHRDPGPANRLHELGGPGDRAQLPSERLGAHLLVAGNPVLPERAAEPGAGIACDLLEQQPLIVPPSLCKRRCKPCGRQLTGEHFVGCDLAVDEHAVAVEDDQPRV